MNRTVDPTRPTLRDIIDPNSAQHRQRLIKKIQKILGGKLIVYTANSNIPLPAAAAIFQQDAMNFEDLLRSTGDSKKGYLILTSPGGDPNAAEKLLMMCRERFTEGFHVIVPNYAKSAATLICLGADKILMGYMAELGPIDPQIQVGLDMIRERIKGGEAPVTYLPMLAQIPPQLIAICENAIEASRETAAKWLKKHMLKDNPNHAEVVADQLSNGVNYKSHGKVIDYSEAKDVLKLNVERIDPNSELWDYVWELFVRSMAYFQTPIGRNVAKLYESETVSLSMGVQLVGVVAQQPPPQAPAQPLPKAPPQVPPQATPKMEPPIQA